VRVTSTEITCEPNRHPTFTDRGGDHLRRPRTHITDGEDAWPPRLDRELAATEPLPRVAIAQARQDRWAT